MVLLVQPDRPGGFHLRQQAARPVSHEPSISFSSLFHNNIIRTILLPQPSSPITTSGSIPIPIPIQSLPSSVSAAAEAIASFIQSGPPGSAPSPPWLPINDDDGLGKKAKRKHKREWADDNRRNDYDDYPFLIKIKEKRKPSGNIQPYCQQMQILDDTNIVPIGAVERIPVPELEDTDGVLDLGKRLRRSVHGVEDEDDDFDIGIEEEGTACACEWITG